jgi:signal transduction histidine kinase
MIESPAEEADQLGTTLPAGIPERFWLGIDRVKDFLTGFSVRTKILGIVVGFTIVLGLGVTVQVRAVMSSVLLTELDNRGASVASDVAARATDPLLLNDPFTVYDVLFDTVANHPDAEYAYVVDDSGDVLVHTFGDAGFPIELLDQGPGSTAGGVTRRQFDAAGEHFHEFGAAILDGRLGVVRIGMSETRLDGVVKGITTQMLITTVFVALVGVAAASFLTWLLTRPILDLVDMTRKVGEGDLTSRSQYVANDEVGSLALAFNQMVDDLERNRSTIAETEAARTMLLEKLITAQEEERRRIARELHDTVGQSLSSLMVGIALLSRLSGADAETKAGELQRLAGETLTQVRELSRELRPSALDDLGLGAALDRSAEDFTIRYPDLSVDVHADVPGRLPPATETALYRITQEAIANAARHGDAHNVSVLIVQRNGYVRVIVEDNGSGFDPQRALRNRNSVGLHAMQERSELLGGIFDIESGPDGTTVYVEVPL